MAKRPGSKAMAACVLFAALSLAATSVPPAKRPLTHKDYDAWRTISSQVLSRDGRFLAYAFMPLEGDGEVVVRDLTSGKERREGVGALPPPAVQAADEANPDEPPQRRSVRIAITSDGRFAVATTFPTQAETAEAKKAKKKADEMPKGGLLIVNLATGEATRIASVKSMQVPTKGGSWLAYLKEAKAEEKKPAADEDKKAGEKPAEKAEKPAEEPREARAGGPRGRGGAR